MPLTDEQTTALQTAADALKGADAKDVADALKASLPDVHQHAFRIGYGTAKGEYADKLAAEKAAREAAEAAAEESKAEAERLAGADKDFSAERQRLEAAAQAAKEEAKKAKADALDTVKAHRKAAAIADFKAALISKNVDPKYAEHVAPAEVRDRIRVSDPGEDGAMALSFLDADGVPLQGGLDALVSSYLPGVDPAFIRSTADGGAGTQGGSGRASGNRYAELQKLAKTAAAPGQPAADSEAAKRRAERYAPHSA